ncbi:MAG: hypothetical protein ACI965_001397, partial [Paraglaciecola sp.]
HIECKPFTRQKAVLSLLNGLIQLQKPMAETQVHSNTPVTFADACARLRRLAHPGSLIFLLSDFSQLNDSAKQHIASLSKHCEIIAYPISDPFEHELPAVNVPQQVALTDGQSEQNILLGEKDSAARYFAQHQQRFTEVEDTLKQCRAQVINISAATPLEQQLSQFTRGSGL